VNALFKDAVMRRWPGYTLASLRQEDAHELYQTWQLVVNDKLGEADDGQ
jgi:hypothetical protein